eukprot:2004292-Pyramimonas_sp.AAC.1
MREFTAQTPRDPLSPRTAYATRALRFSSLDIQEKLLLSWGVYALGEYAAIQHEKPHRATTNPYILSSITFAHLG